MKTRSLPILSLLLITASYGQVIWDGGAADGLWTSATNWADDVVPAAGESVNIFNGDTVDVAGLPSGNLPGGAMIVIGGGSTLTQSSGALRLNGASVLVGEGGNVTGGFLDLNNGTVKFEDGASVVTANWEHKGTNQFDFELSATGFGALDPGRLRSGNAAVWADTTYNIDFSGYQVSNGAVVVLADFNGHDAVFNDTFDPAINLDAGESGLVAELAFDQVESRLLLVFETPPIVWQGGGGDDSWNTAANWNNGVIPGSLDEVTIGGGASVIDGPNAFGSLTIRSGASVIFAGDTLSGGKTVTVEGTLDRAGVLRFASSTMNLSGGLGSQISFLDTNGSTMNFFDGATFLNPNMPFEHKGTNKFTYKLSETGFTTINAGTLFDGAGAVWSDVSYEIDLSDYDVSNGTEIVLMDYSSHSAAFDDSFDANVTMNPGASGLDGVLSFDVTTSALVLTVIPSEEITLSISVIDTSELLLEWNTVPGRAYHIFSSSTLEASSWEEVEDNVPFTGASASFAVPFMGAKQFYRIESE